MSAAPPLPAKPAHPPVLLTGAALVGQSSPAQLAAVELWRSQNMRRIAKPAITNQNQPVRPTAAGTFLR